MNPRAVCKKTILPIDGLPETDCPANETLQWMYIDDAAGFRERGGHPVYGEYDIDYRFNSCGYRAPEFSAVGEVRIVAIGCSYVFGAGVAQDDIFHERFAARLRADLSTSVIIWNLGRSGASNDYISRLLYLAVPLFDPHIFLINFTHTARREYLSVENKLMNYIPSFMPPDEVMRDIHSHFLALSSSYDDQLNFFKNYKAVGLLLAGRCWLYSNMKNHAIEPVAAHMDLDRYVGSFAHIDKARDGVHPGPESHKNMAELFWAKFVEIGGPRSLPDLTLPVDTTPVAGS
jgi:hypothetical protein